MFQAGDGLDGFIRHIAHFLLLLPRFHWLGGKEEAGLRQMKVAWRTVGLVAGESATRLRCCFYLASFWLDGLFVLSA